MTPEAIAKLRRTFITIAMTSFFVVIAFMGATSFIANVITMAGQANRTIDAILDAGGEMPQRDNFGGAPFHEEAMYGLRYFTVSYDADGVVEDVDLSHVMLVDRQQAVEVAQIASDPSTITGLGVDGNYFYKEGAREDDGSMVVFLDCSIQLANTRDVGMNTLLICAAAWLVTGLSVVFFSKRAIRSEVENARRQQRFVTNAGHELKTPIAVIRANTELTEMMSGETEWTQSTMRQVDRLDRLVRDLMTIARGAEQASSDEPASAVDVTAVVTQAVESFRGMAIKDGVELNSYLSEGVSVVGTSASIEQLTCLLVDNALKYCDEGGAVEVGLAPMRIGKGCTLAVSNSYAAGADVDYQRFFDRFYREDSSHENQQGYGIGLSVAESICKRYHGSIKASWKSGVITFTCTLKEA